MKKHIEKKIKNNIFMIGLCFICFLVIPVILMQFEDGGDGWFGILVPVCTVICFGAMKVVEDKISFWGILICLIFEMIWYKVIYFWRKIEE